MLTSQITSISSQSSLSPLIISTTSSAMYRRPKLSSSLRVTNHAQQTRNFRIGYWASLLNPQKEENKKIKLKHFSLFPKAGNSKLHYYLEWRNCGLGGSGRRWANFDAFQTGKHRPSKENENSKTNSILIDELSDWLRKPFLGKRWGSTTSKRGTNVYGFGGKGNGDNAAPSQKTADQKPYVEEYEYDPVSNRMVPKRQPSPRETTESFPRKVNIDTSQGYRSQFANFRPPSLDETVHHLDGPPPKAELDAYKPFKYNEPDGKPTASSTEPLIDPEFPPNKEELDAYKAFRYNEPDGKSPAEIAAAKSALSKEDLKIYQAFRYNEPDGKSPEEIAATKVSPPKEELEAYKAFRYNEPDGHAPEKQDPLSESLKEYEGKSKTSAESLPFNDSETSYIGNVDHELLRRVLAQSRSKIEEGLRAKNGASTQGVIDPEFPNDAEKYQTPYKYNEPDGKIPVDVGGRDSDFPEDIHKYQNPFKYNEPDGKMPVTANTRDSDFPEDAHRYQSPYKYNEPDGKKPVVKDARDSDFPEDAHKYQGPYRHNEPDGKMPEVTDTRTLDFPEDAYKYQSPYEYNEPDGEKPLYTVTRESGAVQCLWDDISLDKQRHETFISILEDQGVDLDAIAEETGDYDLEHIRFSEFPEAKKELDRMYEDLGYYTADGEWIFFLQDPQKEVVNEFKDFPDDAHKYENAFRYNEPDGHAPEETIISRGSQEKEPFIDEPKPTPEELKLYNAYRYQEPDGHAPEKADPLANVLKEKDYLSKSTFWDEEPEKIQSSNYSPSMITAFDTANRDRSEDLDLLRASDIRAASGKSKVQRKETDAEKESRRKALEADFNAFSLAGAELKKPTGKKLDSVETKKEMTGNFVRDFPEEFNTKWNNAGSTLVPENSDSKTKEAKIQADENDYAAGIASQDAYTRSGSNSARMQTSLDRSGANAATKISNNDADEHYKLQAEIDPYSKEPQGLETSYAEEVAKEGGGDLGVFVSSYGCGETKDINGNPEISASKAKDQELVNEVKGIYEDTYGVISSSHRQDHSASEETTSQSSAKSESADEKLPTKTTTLYKILAFEPSTQSIKIAETTSIVADKSGPPSTPAEVLMRLSNPAKFFPHFEPLGKEGYEIVSGSGDILIFKKVRDVADIKEKDARSRGFMKGFIGRNPVDGMYPVSPATGNFASPTGFVNYDFPNHDTAPHSSPSYSSADNSNTSSSEANSKFKSNIDVRREEPVFSGRKKWEDRASKTSWKNSQRKWKREERDRDGRGGKKKMGKAKRVLVGAGVVGGVVYAGGVVGEWLRTGGEGGVGTDGRF